MLTKTVLGEIDAYLALQPYSDQTRASYGYQIQRFIKWCSTEGYTLTQFGPNAFLRYSDENQWARDSSVQRQAYLAIRGYLRWKLGKDQPLEGLRLRRVRAGPQRTLSVEELDHVFASLLNAYHNAVTQIKRRCATRDIAIVSLIIDTGLRSTELCTLKLAGLDLENRRVSVLGKRRKWRDPLFSQITEERLRIWLKVRPLVAKPCVNRVFVSISGNTPGRAMTYIGLRCIMNRIAREAGIKHFSPMALRRTMATLLICRGAPTRIVQAQGGWSKLESVQLYTQAITPADIEPFFATG